MSSSRKRLIVSSTLIMVLVLGIWALATGGEDPELARVKQIAKQLRGPDAENLTPEERKERWQEFREAFGKLDPDQKRQYFQERMDEWLQRDMERMDRFFKLSPQERLAALDAEIKRDEERRKQFEKMRAEWAKNPDFKNRFQGKGPPKGSSNTEGNSQTKRQPPTAEQRENWRKQWLNKTTPEYRAQRAEYRRLLSERRKQLGLPERRGRGPRP
ncbi:MAG: hypothetical protein KatS3mg105_4239 [Gemmatales bacterium]|nr:MAG: hypothetical protein KatS3mg105_4239 [Gemmatales bacterium]